jgi:hypothetical protein
MRMPRGRPGRRRGSASIEFALLVPFLLMFFYGIFEYGWMFFHRTAVQEAGRQGCRHGATLNAFDHDVEGEVIARTEAVLENLGIDCARNNCEVTVEVEGEVPEQRLRCAVTMDHRSITNALPIPDTLAAGYLYYIEVQ